MKNETLSFLFRSLSPRFSNGDVVNASVCPSVRQSVMLFSSKPLGGF